MTDVLPPLHDDESRSLEGNYKYGNGNVLDNGGKGNSVLVGQPFAEAGVLLPLCRDARRELVDLCYQVRITFVLASQLWAAKSHYVDLCYQVRSSLISAN